MGKFIWGLIQVIFAVAVIAALAYTYNETQNLRAEISHLKGTKSVVSDATGNITTNTKEKIADPVSTQGHLKRAQDCLKKKDLGCFREEMASAGQSAEKQGTDTIETIDNTRKKVEELQKTLSGLSKQAGKLWEVEKKP
jgi:flagellar motility protein MotE (MotC chaperone)